VRRANERIRARRPDRHADEAKCEMLYRWHHLAGADSRFAESSLQTSHFIDQIMSQHDFRQFNSNQHFDQRYAIRDSLTEREIVSTGVAHRFKRLYPGKAFPA
jgi:hypothetical protein